MGLDGEVGRSIGVGGRCWSWTVCQTVRALMGLGGEVGRSNRLRQLRRVKREHWEKRDGWMNRLRVELRRIKMEYWMIGWLDDWMAG